ncbi:MAG: hypothetical protein IRZ13_04145 [Acetobacteraceae bacterium]|nr:hypothetical protein [Acetobacteraceae bacterium]
MFVGIREVLKLGSLDGLSRKVEAEFVPVLRELAGFHHPVAAQARR